MEAYIEQLFADLGLTPQETRVYVALLKLGMANLEQIAKQARVPRSSAYGILESLERRGFVGTLVKKKRRLFTPQSPQKILKNLEETTNVFRGVLPDLQKMQEGHPVRAQIRFFEGREGIRAIFKEILNEKRNFDAITSIEDMSHVAKEYFDTFIAKRVEGNLRVRLIANRGEESVKMKTADSRMLRVTRFVPERYKFNTANYIFGNNVAILSLKQEPIAGIIIKDEDIAETHRMYFDILWTMASSA